MKAPKIPTLFKLGQHSSPRTFKYEPRIYNERRERLLKREAEIRAEMRQGKPDSAAEYESDASIRERLSDSWVRRDLRRQQRNSGRRLLLILAALILLVYLIYDKFDKLL